MICSWKNRASRLLWQDPPVPNSGWMFSLAVERLALLNAAQSLQQISPLKSVGLHALKGSRKGQWAIHVNGPWRICFKFREGHVWDVEIVELSLMEEKEVPMAIPVVHPGSLLRRELESRAACRRPGWRSISAFPKAAWRNFCGDDAPYRPTRPTGLAFTWAREGLCQSSGAARFIVAGARSRFRYSARNKTSSPAARFVARRSSCLKICVSRPGTSIR